VDSALEKLPAYEGKTYRVVRFEDDVDCDEFLGQHWEGGLVGYGQYLSTAKPGTSLSDGETVVKLIVRGKQGRDISELSTYPSEGEVLLPRSSTFTVRHMRYNEDGYAAIIELEEV
jgi:hypothetical protein